jgi:hypothetical protein
VEADCCRLGPSGAVRISPGRLEQESEQDVVAAEMDCSEPGRAQTEKGRIVTGGVQVSLVRTGPDSRRAGEQQPLDDVDPQVGVGAIAVEVDAMASRRRTGSAMVR